MKKIALIISILFASTIAHADDCADQALSLFNSLKPIVETVSGTSLQVKLNKSIEQDPIVSNFITMADFNHTTNAITIHSEFCNLPESSRLSVLAHELGHAVDHANHIEFSAYDGSGKKINYFQRPEELSAESWKTKILGHLQSTHTTLPDSEDFTKRLTKAIAAITPLAKKVKSIKFYIQTDKDVNFHGTTVLSTNIANTAAEPHGEFCDVVVGVDSEDKLIKLSERYNTSLDQTIQLVLAHEIGHCLNFSRNFGQDAETYSDIFSMQALQTSRSVIKNIAEFRGESVDADHSNRNQLLQYSIHEREFLDVTPEDAAESVAYNRDYFPKNKIKNRG